MELKNEITKFNLRENGEVDKDDKNGKISEAFKPIAEMILSGYFKVSKNNSGKNGVDCYSKNGHAVTVLTRQS